VGAGGFDPLYGKVLTKSDEHGVALSVAMCVGNGVFAALRSLGESVNLTMRTEGGRSWKVRCGGGLGCDGMAVWDGYLAGEGARG
jgi:hypothetical protein